ncbi:hypothetical protein QAD02_017986 [Eretmocerus hayati]|uniref:Uncharacterized protein n=1 Tax=Eretmocerus hayati TaxID=131215 RepID=A0ACC2PF45_9HYME|nr:hypothetical protein QAD02_017986 [Eretmocerus hayati]
MSKKRRYDSSSDSSSDEENLRKRIKRLEKEYEKKKKKSKRHHHRRRRHDSSCSDSSESSRSSSSSSLIGKRSNEERVLAPPLHSEFAIRSQDVIEIGLSVEERADYLKKYTPPKNCLFIDPPKINPEMKSVAVAPVLYRDARISQKQEKIACCFGAVAKGLSHLIKDGRDLEDLPVIEALSDTLKMLADLQREECSIRRNLISKNINASLRDTLAETKCNEWLFGDKLDDLIKSAKALENTAKDLRAPARTNSTNKGSKNSNAPPRHQGRDQQKTWSGQKEKSHKKPQYKNSTSRNRSNYSKKDRDHHRRR